MGVVYKDCEKIMGFPTKDTTLVIWQNPIVSKLSHLIFIRVGLAKKGLHHLPGVSVFHHALGFKASSGFEV